MTVSPGQILPARGSSARALILLVGAVVGLSARRSQATGDPPETRRVAILALQAGDLLNPEVEQVPDVIGRIVASHPGFEVISTAGTEQALNAGEARQPGCAASESCLVQVGQELRADLVLSGTLVRAPHGFVVSFALTTTHGGQEPAHTSESMRLRRSLGLNITLCVNRLFGWSEQPKTVASGPRRAAIFDVPADGVPVPAAAQVPDLIGRIVASHAGFEVIPAADLNGALQAAEAHQPGCAVSEACRTQVAHDLKADIVFAATLEAPRSDGGHRPAYVLSLAVSVSGTGKAATRKTSESMRLLKSLALNVTLCLNRLLGWDDHPGAFAVEPTPPAPVAQVIPPTDEAVVSTEPATPALPAPPSTIAPAPASTPASPASPAPPDAIAPAPAPASTPAQGAIEAFLAVPESSEADDRKRAPLALTTSGSFDVLFGSGLTSRRWLLLDSAGVPLDRLPCRRVVPARSGWKLKLVADRTEQPVTLDLPPSFDFLPGHRVRVFPQRPFLPELTVPGSKERVLLWLFGLGGVAALEVVGGLFAGGGAAIGSNMTPPNPMVAVPLMAAGGALLVTVVALQAVARPGLEVTGM